MFFSRVTVELQAPIQVISPIYKKNLKDLIIKVSLFAFLNRNVCRKYYCLLLHLYWMYTSYDSMCLREGSLYLDVDLFSIQVVICTTKICSNQIMIKIQVIKIFHKYLLFI